MAIGIICALKEFEPKDLIMKPACPVQLQTKSVLSSFVISTEKISSKKKKRQVLPLGLRLPRRRAAKRCNTNLI
jgi:hypothetical protein